MKKKMRSNKIAMEIGAGLVAAGAVAAAGYYFYGSTDAKKHRKIVTKWATEMKKEVIKESKHLKDVNPEAFVAIVDRVVKQYKAAGSVDVVELKRAASELKANWQMVRREAKGTARRSISDAKKTVKKAVKKTVAKPSK